MPTSRRAAAPDSRLRRAAADPLNLVAVAALLVWAGIALFARPIGDYGVETDFYGNFAPGARDLMHGAAGVLDGFRGPFYYLLLGVAGAILRDAFLAGKLLSMVAAAATLRVAGGMLRQTFGAAAGVAGALFLAANPVFVEYAVRASSDLPFLALFAGSLALVLGGGGRPDGDDAGNVGPKWLRWAGAGVLAGAAWLTRYTGGVLLPVGIVAGILLVRPGRRGAAAALVFAGAFAVVAAPWAITLWRATGNPLWNLNYQNVAIEVYASKPGLAQNGRFMSAVGFGSLGEVIRTDPGRFLHVMAGNAVSHLWRDARDLVGLPWAVAALAGFVLSAPRWRGRRPLVFAGAGVLTYAALLPVFYGARFMLPLLLWWGAGVAGLAGAAAGFLARRRTRVDGSRFRRVRVEWGFLLLACLAAITAGGEVRADRDLTSAKGAPLELLCLARQVEKTGAHFGPDTPIAARKPQFGWLLGAPTVPIPLGSLGALRTSGAHYLLVSGMEVMVFPSLRALAEVRKPGQVPRGLRLIGQCRVEVAPGAYRDASLFQVEDPVPWTPPARGVPAPPDRDRVDGLSRLDTLRYRLVRWYLRWDPAVPMEPILARMSPADREAPAVIALRGDIALDRGDAAGARDRYARALEAAPSDDLIRLRMAGAAWLQGDRDGYRGILNGTALAREVRGRPGWTWCAAADSLRNRAEFEAAIAPAAYCAERHPGQPRAYLLLGDTLRGLGHYAKAREALRRYLALRPDDRTVRDTYNSLLDRTR